MNSYPRKYRILIVDDEPGFTEMVKLNLETTGRFLVKAENHGTNAVTAALEFGPDLILLDVIMPDVEGPDVCCQLKNDPRLTNVPIIFLTATIRKEEIDTPQGLIAGHSFLAKPSTPSELISCIEDRLKSNAEDF